jgi:hypothetical protein
MALQSSGPISIDNIRTELGQAQANSSLRSLSNLAGKTTPDAMSEFYGYSSITYDPIDLGYAYGDPGEACGVAGGEGYQTKYYIRSAGFLTGSVIYNNTSGTPYNGGDNWFFVRNQGISIFINSNGEVVQEYTC